MTGLLAARLVATAVAALAVVPDAAGAHRLARTARSQLSSWPLKFIGADGALIASGLRALSFISIGDLVVVSLATVVSHVRAAYSADIDGAIR
jgi:hypothetical protein